MGIDVAELLREFDLSIVEGRSRVTWLLRAPDGGHVEVEPTAAVSHLNAHAVRSLTDDGRHRLLVGETATDGVVMRALAGEVDIITAEPPRLIHAGHEYALHDEAPTPSTRPAHARLAWTRWAVERFLMLATEPARQGVIAATVRTSQQSVSNTVRHLAALVSDDGTGLVATDRAQLLRHWHAEYAGPKGLELGWYSLDPVLQQTIKALEAADRLEVKALVSGDVAADKMAPWKLPARGRVYLERPVDLARAGFVPAPVGEATLVTCIPLDPSLWRLTNLRQFTREPDPMPLADPAIVYWDLKASGELDSAEAADHVAAVLTNGRAS